MSSKHKTRLGLIRAFALAVAVLFVLLVTQAPGHSHENGHNEAACQICQAAHIGAVPTVGVELLSSPLLAAGYVKPFIVAFHQELFFQDSPSRAPPSA